MLQINSNTLSKLQHLQDLLAKKLEISLVLIDPSGKEITIPSKIPSCCFNSNNTNKECEKEKFSLLNKISKNLYQINYCHKKLFSFAYKTEIFKNNEKLLLLGGRISNLERLKENIELIKSIYSLPLGINKDENKSSQKKDVNYTPLQSLTKQEINIIFYLGKGLSNKDIASELFISTNTVKTHVSRIFKKLNLSSRLDAAFLAYETGLVKRDEIV